MNFWPSASRLRVVALALLLVFGLHGALFVADQIGLVKDKSVAVGKAGDSIPCNDRACPCHMTIATAPEPIRAGLPLDQTALKFSHKDDILPDGIVRSIDLPPQLV